MAVSLAYLDDLARVRIVGTAMPGTYSLVERSTDQIRWTPVRGGSPIALASGGFTLDDYEFTADVPNYYRISPAAAPVPIALPALVTVDTDGDGLAKDLDFTGLDAFNIASKMIRVTLSIPNVNRVNQLRMYLGLTGTFTDHIRYSFFHRTSGSEFGMSGEVWTIDLKLAEIAGVGGSITLSADGVPSVKAGFTAIRFRLNDDAAGAASVTIHNIELVPVTTNRGFVSICFDDGLASVPALAKPKLDALGFVATTYPVVGRIDSGADWQTTADLEAMVTAGWEIGGHAVDPAVHTATLGGVTAAVARADLDANIAWLRENFPNAAGRYTMAYPQGVFETTTDGASVESLVRGAGYSAGRTTLARNGETTHIQIAGNPEVLPFRIHALSGISSVTDAPGRPEDLLAAGGILDKVEANGGWLILTFHEIVTGTPVEPNEINQDDFDDLMDGIAARNLGVGTVQEVLDTYLAVVTPQLETTWLKSLTRPFLNRPIQLVGHPGDISRPARNGIFEVVGRSFPVARTGIRGSRRQDIAALVRGTSDADDFDLVLASGDTMFIHVPPGTPQLSGSRYAVIGDTTQAWVGRDTDDVYVFTLPLTEVAAPDVQIVGSTVNWTGIMNAFATWSDVIAGEDDWADVMDRIGEPTDVIVP